MSKRFGRKQKRAAAAQGRALELALGNVAHLHHEGERKRQEIAALRDRAQRNDILADILRDARGMVASLTAKEIVEAESEFLRDALAQLRRQGGAAVTLEANAPRFDAPSSDDMVTVLTVRIPPIYRSFGVKLPNDRRERRRG